MKWMVCSVSMYLVIFVLQWTRWLWCFNGIGNFVFSRDWVVCSFSIDLVVFGVSIDWVVLGVSVVLGSTCISFWNIHSGSVPHVRTPYKISQWFICTKLDRRLTMEAHSQTVYVIHTILSLLTCNRVFLFKPDNLTKLSVYVVLISVWIEL